jgi:hypothetical protein
VLHVQRASKDKWAKYEPVQMPLTGCTAVERRIKTLICSKLITLNTACLNLTSGPQPPPGDWYTRGEVRSGTACSIHAWQCWHFHVYTCSHGIHLNVNHVFWFAPSSHTVYIPCSWEYMQGLPEPETTLTIACDTQATRSSVSVGGFNSFESLEGR